MKEGKAMDERNCIVVYRGDHAEITERSVFIDVTSANPAFRGGQGL